MANRLLLELENAKPAFDESSLPPALFNLKLRAGECIVVECRDSGFATAFADLCSGMIDLDEGHIHFKGLDWFTLYEPRLSALRGRIGRIFQYGCWVDLYPVSINILLPMLHHTTIDMDKLLEQALTLCQNFGLPGLPTGIPRRTTDIDLARAACVKALLGRPDLLLLEYPCEGYINEIMPPFLEALNKAQNQGTGVICLTRQLSAWDAYKTRVTQWMRLEEKGLTTVRSI